MLLSISTDLFQHKTLKEYGWIAFQLGVFFLPSTVFISALFLLFAIIISSCSNTKFYLNDLWNYPFIISALIMILGSFSAYSGWLAWIGLANWLPLFWGFWGFQYYLQTSNARKRIVECFVAGTVPVLVTGLGQIWFGLAGPWQVFNGLIIWFIDNGGEPLGRLSGLFDYANIAAAWLAFVWPLSLATLLQPFLNQSKRILVFVIAIAIVCSLILTDSRNAWGALVLAVPFVFGPSRWYWLLPALGIFLLPIVLAVFPWIPSDLQLFARKIVPEGLWSRLNDMQYIENRSLASTRLGQWNVALNFVFERPWFGWGAAAFTVLYPLRTGQWHGHTHNLPLEIAVSHGVIVAILLVGTVLALLITALRFGILNDVASQGRNLSITIFDRAWWAATFVLVAIHATDIPFFDSRINIAGWILLAGLRNLVYELQSVKHFDSKLPVDV